ncbi:DNA helicase [Pseudomonas sp. R2.Fl]|nr:DNA helicase [Pseudomonas sp. R2.Fl]
MTFSAPVYYLKRKAKLISRRQNIPLHEALDRVAREEGFATWSLLAAKVGSSVSDSDILGRLRPGDLVLIGARPGQGKTLMGLRLAVAAMQEGRQAAFFTLVYSAREVDERFRAIGLRRETFGSLFALHDSDEINAAYIVDALAHVPKGCVAVVDYLQALDHRRDNPDILTQIRLLRAMARERGIVLAFISQIDRSYDVSGKTLPDLADVRLPNPLDLSLFDKSLFLNKGEMRFSVA